MTSLNGWEPADCSWTRPLRRRSCGLAPRAAEACWHQWHPGVVDHRLGHRERARPRSYPRQPAALSAHVAALCRAGYYQLRQLRPLVQSMTAETVRNTAPVFYLVGWTVVIRWSTVCRTLYCASCSLCRTPLHDWLLARDTGTTRTPLATHPTVCQVQSGMSGSPVALRAGASLLGRWLLPRVRQHSALSAVSWCFDLRGAANTQQLQRQNFYSRLGNSLPVQLRNPDITYGLFRVQTTAEWTPFSASLNQTV